MVIRKLSFAKKKSDLLTIYINPEKTCLDVCKEETAFAITLKYMSTFSIKVEASPAPSAHFNMIIGIGGACAANSTIL